MKTSAILLVGSLTANGVLLGLLMVGPFGGKTSTSVAAPVPSPAVATKSSGPTISSDAWSDLRPGDLPGLAGRLRAAGFPPAVIRALLAEQIRAQFAARRTALNRAAPGRRFWEPPAPDPQTAAALARLDQEEKRALQEALGTDIALDDPAFHSLRRQLPDFSVDKILALHRIQQAFAEKSQELFSAGGSFLMETRDALQKEQRAEIARLLTPSELEEFDLRTGNVANNLRNRLAAIDPTEQEFRALHRLQQAFDDQYGRITGMIDLPAEQRSVMLRQRSEAQRQLNEQIKSVLGDQRYADYQRATDGSYEQTARLVARFALPPETTNQVYAVQQDIQQRATALPPDDRNTQLATLAAEAQKRVTAILGPEGYDAYKQHGGFWLQNLQPRSIPPGGARAGGRGGGGR